MKKVSIGIICLILVIILGSALFWGYLTNKTSQWTNIIFPNIKIEDVDVSGKTFDEAKDVIKKEYGELILKKNITVRTSDKEYRLEFSKLDARYDINEAVKQAFNYGKNLNIIDKYKLIKKPEKQIISLKFVYDPKPIKEFISIIQKEVEKKAQNASISIVNGNFQIAPEKKGIKLLNDKLETSMMSKINGDITPQEVVVEAPEEEVVASITSEKLKTIDTKLSTFTTNFGSSDYSRSTNIQIATSSINNKIVMPGQSFSFNDTVGQRTAARGYKMAPVIVGTKVNSDFGGGICQVSTTLYNAIMRANIPSTERTHHTLPSHYIGPALDATVDWGNLDYKFTNTLSYPVYIQAYIENKNIYFAVYSNFSLSNKKYDFVNEIYARIEPGVKYIDDPNLLEGETVQEQSPSQGIKARAYINTYENGQIIEHKQVSDDFYKPVDEIIRRGTRK